MNNKIIMGVFVLLLLIPTCSFYQTQGNNDTKTTLLIQGICDAPLLTSLINTIPQAINDSIKQELGLSAEYDFDFFLPKKLNRLTLYYISDVQKENENIVFSALKDIQENPQNYAVEQVAVGSEIEFFGDNKDELVAMIDDPKGELMHINNVLKMYMHEANKEYACAHGADLYDITKSERFLYLPHIGLGRIRSQSIKQQIKDDSQVDVIFERIRTRIKEFVLGIKQELSTTHSQQIVFSKIGLLDLYKQVYVKEYAL